MPLFVIFVFAAMTLGAGAMLAPALPTPQPRIGLAGALALTLVVGGAVLWTFAFGWDRLIVDYLVFGLVSVIVVGGTLSYGQMRAEKRGQTLTDAAQGWIGRWDLLLFALVLVGLILLFNAVPTPMYPLAVPTLIDEITPAYPVLAIYITEALGQSPEAAQTGVMIVLCLLTVWTAYDLGAEVQDKRLGRALALTMLPGLLLLTLHWDAVFRVNAPMQVISRWAWLTRLPPDALLATPFALAALTFGWRFTRSGYPVDALLSGLMLGAVTISDLDSALLVGVLLVLLVLSSITAIQRKWAVILLPLGSVIGAGVWLVRVWGNLPAFDAVSALSAIVPSLVIGGGLWWLSERVVGRKPIAEAQPDDAPIQNEAPQNAEG